MSILNVFQGKKYKEEIENLQVNNTSLSDEIQNLQANNTSLSDEIQNLQANNTSLSDEIQKYKAVLTDDHNKAIEINELHANLKIKESELNEVILQKESKISELQCSIENLGKEIVELDDEKLYQSFALYTPMYDFASSDQYKEELVRIRNHQKEMIKNKTAVTSHTKWEVNGSKAAGTKMTNDNIKQILRSFNTECENVIDRVKFNNFHSMNKRITKSYEMLNKLNETNQISIEIKYLALKRSEIILAYEYERKKQEEKDELRMIREQQREDAKVAKEIEERRREIEKEQQHYNNVLKRLDDQISSEKGEERLELLMEKRKEVENNLADLDLALKEVDYREANQRAGYVYVISNLGAFGDNIYKIGMTRRLDPQDRIDELGNASVPFKFDVHAVIFSDDAPKLENALHKSFENKRINMMNNRKEFFNVTLEEIEEVVKLNHDKTVEFVRTSPAQQYRESLRMKEKSTR